MKKILLTIMLIALLCFPRVALPATVHLSAGGSDTAPYETWAKASTLIATINALNLANDDEVHIRPGDTFDDATLTLNGTAAGKSGIVIKGVDGDGKTIAGDGRPIFDGDAIRPVVIDHALVNLTIKDIDIGGQDYQTGKTSNMWLQNINGLVLDGIYGDGRGASADNIANQVGKTAVKIHQCLGTVEVKNCNLHHWGPDTLGTYSTDISGIEITRCESGTADIHDNTVYYIEADAFYIERDVGMTWVKVRDNTAYNNGEDCLDIKGCDNVDVYGNDFYRGVGFTGQGGSGGITLIVVHPYVVGAPDVPCTDIDIYENKVYDCTDGRGISVTAGTVGAGETQRVKIRHNWVDGCAPNIEVGEFSKDVEIFSNLLTNPQAGNYCLNAYSNTSTGGKIYNNTMWSDQVRPMRISRWDAVEIKNNIVVTTAVGYAFYDSNNGTAPALSYNCWYALNATHEISYRGTEYTDQATWIAAGHVGALLDTDPLFTNPAGDDFTLKPNSPCRQGADYLVGYETKLRPGASWPNNVTTMNDILSIGAYGVYRGSAGM